jgi:hypothetical protein
MSAKDIFIPKEDRIQAAGNDFHWSFGGDPIYAESTSFHRALFQPTGEVSWVFSSSTGSIAEGNFFGFQLMVPYIDDSVLEYTYKLGDGKDLHVSHLHSIPTSPGYIGVKTVDADDAELTIRLDPVNGTVQGDFNALFKSDGYRLFPQGTFKLIRDF